MVSKFKKRSGKTGLFPVRLFLRFGSYAGSRSVNVEVLQKKEMALSMLNLLH